MGIYRPKRFIIYTYQVLDGYTATISCAPQSRWELIKRTDTRVKLANKNVAIELSLEDFEEKWKEVEQWQI